MKIINAANDSVQEDEYSWREGRVVEAAPMGERSIVLVAEVDQPDGTTHRRDMFMLVKDEDANDTLNRVNDMIGEDSRLCIEEKPQGERGAISGGMPILSVILSRDVNERDKAAFG